MPQLNLSIFPRMPFYINGGSVPISAAYTARFSVSYGENRRSENDFSEAEKCLEETFRIKTYLTHHVYS
jgi:hypothetical protein